MTEYQFHWWPSGERRSRSRIVTLEAESPLHGASLALRHFRQLGCDIAMPLAHVDTRDAAGVKHTLMVEEILEWLSEPQQQDFITRAGLSELVGDPTLWPPHLSRR